jgi:hypothetical protein
LSDFRIDLAVAAPGCGDVPTLAVLLDGPAWATRLTTADRDGAPVSVLGTIMGWPDVARVWLPAWLSDPEAVVRDLVRRAHASAQAPRSAGEARASTAWASYEPSTDEEPAGDAAVIEPETGKVAPSLGDVEESTLSREPWEAAGGDFSEEQTGNDPERYRERDLGPYSEGVLERLDYDPRARQQVVEVMVAIVEESGPISIERLCRRIVKAYGRTRLVADRLAQLRAMVPQNLRRDREESFLWPSTRGPQDWSGFRTSDDIKVRPLTDIALLEIANAMAYVATQAMGIGEDELFRQTYKLFGGNRLTGPVRERFANALRVGIARQRLELRAGVISASR